MLIVFISIAAFKFSNLNSISELIIRLVVHNIALLSDSTMQNITFFGWSPFLHIINDTSSDLSYERFSQKLKILIKYLFLIPVTIRFKKCISSLHFSKESQTNVNELIHQYMRYKYHSDSAMFFQVVMYSAFCNF